MVRDRLAGSTGTPQYELSHLNYGNASGDQIGLLDDSFYTEISEIQDEINRLNQNIDDISRLHAKQLEAVELSGSDDSRRLEALKEETRSMSFTLKKRLQTLRSQPVDTRSASIRGPHIERVRKKFMDTIERFQMEEKSYRDRTKDRMARQYKIVKPDASPEEVQAVVESGQDAQIFANATTGARYGQAQSAYNAVRDRHEELKRIEASLAELAQLFHDISLLVEQQGETIDYIEEKARVAEVDLEKGKDITIKARISALSYRKGRWICLGLSILIIIIIAIIVAVAIRPSSDKR